jgi:hypothetical protein
MRCAAGAVCGAAGGAGDTAGSASSSSDLVAAAAAAAAAAVDYTSVSQLALSVVQLEAQVTRLAELLANVISDTKGRVEKKQAQVRACAASGGFSGQENWGC